MMKNKMKTVRLALRVTSYIMTVMLVFMAIAYICMIDSPVEDTSIGSIDLSQVNFENRTVSIQNYSFIIYPNVFYSPEDFSSGNVTVEGVPYGTIIPLGDYGTLRLEVKLPPGEIYALAGKSTSYAQTLYVDGKELGSIGVPAERMDEMTPKSMRFIEAFYAEEESVEIIIHYSALVHADGGGLYAMDIGPVKNVTRNEEMRILQAAAVSIALLASALFFFGLFLFFHNYRYLLWFSLICGALAVSVFGQYIGALLPDLSWYLYIRLAYILNGCFFLFSSLFINRVFPGMANKWAVRFGVALFCGIFLFICIAPTTYFTRFPVVLSTIYAVFLAYMLLSVAAGAIMRRLKSPLPRLSIILLFIGLVIFFIFLIRNIHTSQHAVLLLNLDYYIVGMLVFLFLNMLALTLGFAHTEEQLHEVRRSEREIKKTNQMLESLNRARIQFLEKISHEMKTPLAVMSSGAGRTLKQIRKNTVNEETEKNLDAIQHEAVRLGRLVEQLMVLSLEKERQLTLDRTDAMTLMKKAADVCAPICEGNGNRVDVYARPELIHLSVDTDSFLQVFINLIINANKHTKNDRIVLSAELDRTQDIVVFQVSDRGDGIAPELLDSIWKPGVSGDGGTGMGLAICKEITEEHGGEITVHSDGRGTSIRFTIPAQKEGE